MFTKKYNNTLMDTKEYSVEISEKYNAALQAIKRLEHQLKQQEHDFNLLSDAHAIMSDGIKYCVASLADVHEKLQAKVTQVNQTNSALKSSGDGWFRRAIKLEFDVLILKDELKKVEHERDLAIKKVEHLHASIISTNNKGRIP